MSIAPGVDGAERRFRVTHPYHPLFGREFELVTYRHNWGEDRVYFRCDGEVLRSLPACWTSAAPQDPFVVIAVGRSHFRLADLLQLGTLLQRLGEEGERGV